MPEPLPQITWDLPVRLAYMNPDDYIDLLVCGGMSRVNAEERLENAELVKVEGGLVVVIRG